MLMNAFPSLDGDGRGRKLASRYGQRAHRRPDIYRSSGRLACDGFWCFWCKHPRFCHNGNNGRHNVTNKRLQFSSLSCLGQPQWGGVRSGTYLATLHHLSRQFCMTFNLTLRLSELGREVTGRRAPRRGTLFGRSMVHSLDHLPRLMLVPLALFQVSLTPTTCFRGHKVSRWQKWSLKLPGLSRPLRKTVRSISLSRPFCISASRPKLECRDTR